MSQCLFCWTGMSSRALIRNNRQLWPRARQFTITIQRPTRLPRSQRTPISPAPKTTPTLARKPSSAHAPEFPTPGNNTPQGFSPTKSQRRDQRYHFFVLLSGTIFFTVCSFYGYSYYKLVKTTPIPTQEQLDSLDLEGVWKKDNDNEAGKVRAMRYDDEINSTEWWAGLYKLRKQLISEATGDVLESAVGTGRNGEYYAQVLADRAMEEAALDEKKKRGQEKPKSNNHAEVGKLKSVTLVDVSESMLDVAMDKWKSVMTRPDYRHAGGVPARFVVGDLAAENFNEIDGIFKRPSESASESSSSWPRRFDTIIQTNALCSTKHPVVLLRNLAKLVKPDGKILLLEHGRSHYDVVNNVLDRTAIDHAKRHGCLWNRDIQNIVSESGLDVEYIKRTSLGTHYYYVLRPKSSVV